MENRIDMLAPSLQLLIKQLQLYFPTIGISTTYRTVEEQESLYSQGRTTPGDIVTNARGVTYDSQHQWGIAFDFYKNVAGHAYDDAEFFNRVGLFCLERGFGWGGTWSDFPDRPHIYIPTWGDTTKILKDIYGDPETFMHSDVFNSMLVVDGVIGKNTISALELYFDQVPDGFFSSPSPTVKALQMMLNKSQNFILHKEV